MHALCAVSNLSRGFDDALVRSREFPRISGPLRFERQDAPVANEHMVDVPVACEEAMQGMTTAPSHLRSSEAVHSSASTPICFASRAG